MVLVLQSVCLAIAKHDHSQLQPPRKSDHQERSSGGVPSLQTRSKLGGMVRRLSSAGSAYGSYFYNATVLRPGSIVYSVGIGEDTSWDEAVMRKHGLSVYAFDPTPRAARYVARRAVELGPRFHFTAEGLATRAGTAVFTLPKNPSHVSMRLGNRSDLGPTIAVKVQTLKEWMRRNGHTQLDVLKMDIEGAEYDILEQWLSRRTLPFDQLLIEFHHRWLPKLGKQRHRAVLAALHAQGFRLIHDRKGQELSFQRARPLPARPSAVEERIAEPDVVSEAARGRKHLNVDRRARKAGHAPRLHV